MKLLEFQSLSSSACDVKCIRILKTMIKIIKQQKGIKKIEVKKNIEQEDYKQTLFNNRQMYHKPFEATIINLGAM